MVRQCDARTQTRLLVTAVRAHSEGNVIVYAPTIARRGGDRATCSAERGIAAVPYHGKMDTDRRRRNQERWMSDEVRVLVGTFAFGLGINKATVRAVIHLRCRNRSSSITRRRAARAATELPADCVLLWQKRDVGLLAHFIEQITDPAEKERAWQRYHAVRRFAESGEVPAPPDLPAFRRDAEVGIVRDVRCLRRDTRVDVSAACGGKGSQAEESGGRPNGQRGFFGGSNRRRRGSASGGGAPARTPANGRYRAPGIHAGVRAAS